MDMTHGDAAPATKGDIKKLAVEIVRTEARIDRLDESLTAKLTEGVGRILKTAEGFMVQVQKVDRHQIITGYRVDELEKRVRTLESR